MVEPRWAPVEARLLPIAKVSISTLINSQGVGDLYRLYLQAERYGMAYSLAYIPADFDVEPQEDFDPEYMKVLFARGYEMARDGYPWATAPPGIDE